MASPSRRQILAGALAAVVLPTRAFGGAAATVVATPSNTVVGPGLPLFGFGMAHYLAGSNTSAWIRYARINAARAFVSPATWILSADLHDDGVTDLASFEATKAALRADPEATTYLNWPAITDRYENLVTSGNRITLNHLFGELTELGVTVVAQSSLGGPWKLDWPEQWRNWQRGYAHAYYLAKTFGVTRFAIINEPDAWGSDPEKRAARLKTLPDMPAFMRCLRFSSDAFRCGVEDAGRAVGTPMRALVHAPVVTRSTMHEYGTSSSGPRTTTNLDRNPAASGYWGGDSRDNTTGWGQAALQGIFTNYAGRTVTEPVFDVYDTHAYNEDPDWYPGELDLLKEKIRAYSGRELPIVYSEINRYNTSAYQNLGHTMEYPPIARDIGHTAAGMTHFGVGRQGGGLLFFKFSNTSGEVGGTVVRHRTGFYYVDEQTGTPYDIRGATRGAETLRLFSRALAGDVDRISVPVSSRPASFHVYGSYDPAAHRYQILTTQQSNEDAVFDLDLSALSPAIPAGHVVTVEEVGQRRAGAVARWVDLPADKKVHCTQPGQSTWLITVPDATVTEQPPLTAVQNALVRNGADADRALGGTTLAVQRRTDAPDEVTFLRFDPAATGTLSRAVLQVYGKVAAGADLCTFWVFARAGLTWDETSLTWNSAPYLAPGDCVLTGTRDDVWPAGQLTVTETFGYHRLDVTDVVEALGGESLTFILVKQPRDAGDTGENDRRVTLLNRLDASTWARPRLRLWTSSA